jgi:hypothetical protein
VGAQEAQVKVSVGAKEAQGTIQSAWELEDSQSVNVGAEKTVSQSARELTRQSVSQSARELRRQSVSQRGS